MKISVIISTFNHPRWLEKVLWGYCMQTFKDYEIIVADDGSGPDTKSMLEAFKLKFPNLSLTHVWHSNKGFRKTKILNQAIKMAKNDYLLFTDGDCIPRMDFLQVHASCAEEGYFLSGGYCKLTMNLSRKVSKEDIFEQFPFDVIWLLRHGEKSLGNLFKILLRKRPSRWADALTTTKATWNGMNSSTFRDYLYQVNGFNEDMEYGGLDRELGERLRNLGIRGKQIRHRAICLHLDHSRKYKSKTKILKNRQIREVVKKNKSFWCKNGLKKNH